MEWLSLYFISCYSSIRIDYIVKKRDGLWNRITYEPPSQLSEEWIENIFTIIVPDTKHIVWKNDQSILWIDYTGRTELRKEIVF